MTGPAEVELADGELMETVGACVLIAKDRDVVPTPRFRAASVNVPSATEMVFVAVFVLSFAVKVAV